MTGESKDFTVDSQDNATRQLYAAGAAMPPVPFRIVLSPCGTSATAVRVGFTGVADSANISLLKLGTGAPTAAGMEVEILDQRQPRLPIDAPSSATSWTTLTPGQTDILDFYARLMVAQAPIIVGRINATATLTLEFQ